MLSKLSNNFSLFCFINPIALRKAKLYTILAFLSAMGLNAKSLIARETYSVTYISVNVWIKLPQQTV